MALTSSPRRAPLPIALAAAALVGARRVPRGLRPPGAIELPGGKRRRARAERRTVVLGVAALATTGIVLSGEVARVWRRGSTPAPAEAPVLERAEAAVLETIDVAVGGHRGAAARGAPLLHNLTGLSLA